MAENLTIARPYAKAAFDSAVEHNSLDKWQSMLEALSLACKDQSILLYLKNASSPSAASDILLKLLDGLLDEFGQNFVRVLGENTRFEVLPEIYDEFVKLRKEYEKVLSVTLTSARPLDNADIEALKQKLSKKYNATISLSFEIDPSIVGGAILQIGDKVIDASVKTSIKNLSSTLI